MHHFYSRAGTAANGSVLWVLYLTLLLVVTGVPSSPNPEPAEPEPAV